jgi:hypothetical protein
MTHEEELIQRYFDAFNRHDIEGVMACFHDEAVLVAPNGKRCAGVPRCGARTKANSRRFPTDFVTFGYAPATAGGE